MIHLEGKPPFCFLRWALFFPPEKIEHKVKFKTWICKSKFIVLNLFHFAKEQGFMGENSKELSRLEIDTRKNKKKSHLKF